MRFCCLLFGLAFVLPALAQKNLPELKDGTVVNDNAEYRHDGPLKINGRVKIQGISLDLRGPITVASGSSLEMENVTIRVSDPPASPNGTSGLRCEGAAHINIRNSTMAPQGSAHPIWLLHGEVSVDNFKTQNSEFHLDHVQANLNDFIIFELEISNSSHVIGKHLQLVFLSTHTGEDEQLTFSDIPAGRPFTRKLQMGSQAEADLVDTSAQIFLLYVHGRSDVTLNRVGRTQLSIAPNCRGTLTLPHGTVGSSTNPVVVPEPGSTECPFRFHLNDVNVDTWDVYAGQGADLSFRNSVIDELTANGNARLMVENSELYADWLSLAGDATLEVKRSTVGALRLAAQRPDLATSEVRLNGRSEATFDEVRFDCGIVAAGNSTVVIRNATAAPRYVHQTDAAKVQIEPADSAPISRRGF